MYTNDKSVVVEVVCHHCGNENKVMMDKATQMDVEVHCSHCDSRLGKLANMVAAKNDNDDVPPAAG